MGPKKRSRFYNLPIHLSEKQHRKPIKVVQHFFTCFHLAEVRELMEDLKKAAMSSSEYDEPSERARVMFFEENLILMVEGVYLMIKDKLPPSLTTPYEPQNFS